MAAVDHGRTCVFAVSEDATPPAWLAALPARLEPEPEARALRPDELDGPLAPHRTVDMRPIYECASPRERSRAAACDSPVALAAWCIPLIDMMADVIKPQSAAAKRIATMAAVEPAGAFRPCDEGRKAELASDAVPNILVPSGSPPAQRICSRPRRT